jgi:hypothetical protein
VLPNYEVPGVPREEDTHSCRNGQVDSHIFGAESTLDEIRSSNQDRGHSRIDDVVSADEAPSKARGEKQERDDSAVARQHRGQAAVH